MKYQAKIVGGVHPPKYEWWVNISKVKAPDQIFLIHSYGKNKFLEILCPKTCGRNELNFAQQIVPK